MLIKILNFKPSSWIIQTLKNSNFSIINKNCLNQYLKTLICQTKDNKL